jgi:hypothetical protein
MVEIVNRRATRPSILADGSFGAFVLDQLSSLGGIVAKPMFGGAALTLRVPSK